MFARKDAFAQEQRRRNQIIQVRVADPVRPCSGLEVTRPSGHHRESQSQLFTTHWKAARVLSCSDRI